MTTHTAGGASGTLETLTAALGNDVLRAVLLPEPSLPVGGIRVHEPGTAQSPGRGDIVLAIGMDDVTAVTALLRRLGGVAAAVATKCRVQDDADVLRAAADSGCGVLVLDEGIDWLQAVALLQGEIARHAADSGPEPSGASTCSNSPTWRPTRSAAP